MRARALGSLLIAASLLAVACPHPPPPPPAAAPAPPEPRGTICERPPRPAPPAPDLAVEASFRAFARDWLARLQRAGDANGVPGGRRQIRDGFEIELRPTHNEQAPWVGILRYCADALRCAEASAAGCQVSATEAITEIFRFQAGEWVY